MSGIAIKLLVGGGVVLAVLLAVWAYGNSRYNAGVDETDAKWVEAGERLARQAEEAAEEADQAAAARIEDEFERVREEREMIDAADDDGSSPIDVLFGN